MLAECVADVSDDEHRSAADPARLGRPLGRPSLPLLFSYWLVLTEGTASAVYSVKASEISGWATLMRLCAAVYP